SFLRDRRRLSHGRVGPRSERFRLAGCTRRRILLRSWGARDFLTEGSCCRRVRWRPDAPSFSALPMHGGPVSSERGERNIISLPPSSERTVMHAPPFGLHVLGCIYQVSLPLNTWCRVF